MPVSPAGFTPDWPGPPPTAWSGTDAAGNPATSTLTDAFTTQDSVKWLGYGGAVVATGGQLRITPDNTYPGIRSAAKYDFGWSSATVEIVQTPNLGTGTTEQFLFVELDSTGANRVSIRYSGGNLAFTEIVNGVIDETNIAHDPVAHRWWRIADENGTLVWSTSPDGALWTVRRSKLRALPVVAAVDVVLASGFFGTEPTPGVAIFDNLNLTPILSPAPATIARPLQLATGAPRPLVMRSTADPVAADALPAPVLTRAYTVTPVTPQPIVASSDAAAEAPAPAVLDIEIAPPQLPKVAPAATVVRSTADPVLVDTPTAVAVTRLPLPPAVAAPAVSVLLSRDVTALQPSSNPAGPVVGRAQFAPLILAPVLIRSTADPAGVVDAPTAPLVVRLPLAPIPFAPAPTLARASGSAEAMPAPLVVTVSTATRALVTAWLTRSTADPAAVVDTPTPVSVPRPAYGPTLGAPSPVLLVSRDVTPAQASSNPATPVVSRAVLATGAAAQPVVTRSTADPAPSTDTPTTPVVARLLPAPQTATQPLVATTRDVTALQPSSNPATPVVGRALWSTTAPPAITAHSTADPAPTDTPRPPLVVRAPQLATPVTLAQVIDQLGENVPPAQARTVVAGAQVRAVAAAVALVVRVATDPPQPSRPTVAVIPAGILRGLAAAAALIRATYGAPPIPSVAGRITGGSLAQRIAGGATVGPSMAGGTTAATTTGGASPQRVTGASTSSTTITGGAA